MIPDTHTPHRRQRLLRLQTEWRPLPTREPVDWMDWWSTRLGVALVAWTGWLVVTQLGRGW